MSKKCPICGRSVAVYQDYVGGTFFFRCNICGHAGCDFEDMTIFDRITESPEVLAPKFVYHVTSFLDGLDKPKKIWYSTIIQGRFFDTETEAKRSTVAKLKEVEE